VHVCIIVVVVMVSVCNWNSLRNYSRVDIESAFIWTFPVGVVKVSTVASLTYYLFV
jgi:hypothetical protein